MFKKENVKIFLFSVLFAVLYHAALNSIPSSYNSEGEIVNIREQIHQTTTVNFATVGDPEIVESEMRSFVRYEIDVLVGRKVVSCVLRDDEYELLGGTNYVSMTYEMMDNGEYSCLNIKPVMEG